MYIDQQPVHNTHWQRIDIHESFLSLQNTGNCKDFG